MVNEILTALKNWNGTRARRLGAGLLPKFQNSRMWFTVPAAKKDTRSMLTALDGGLPKHVSRPPKRGRDGAGSIVGPSGARRLPSLHVDGPSSSQASWRARKGADLLLPEAVMS